MLGRRVTVVVVAMALVVGACGGGSSLSAEEQGIVNEIAAVMMAMPPEEYPQDLFGEPEARCWAEAMVEAVGIEDLRSAGFGSGAFSSTEEAEAALDSVADTLTDDSMGEYLAKAMECVDLTAFVAQEMIGDGVPEEAAYCIAEKMVASDAFFNLMISSMQDEDPDPEVEDEIRAVTLQAMIECLSPEDLADLMGSGG